MYEAVLIVFQIPLAVLSNLISDLRLPEKHIQYWINRNRELHDQCLKDELCRLKYGFNVSYCWGYERNCDSKNSYSTEKVKCAKSNSWGTSSSDQLRIYQNQGDFAKLTGVISTIKPICVSNSTEGSFLECSDHLRFCRATNVFFNFQNLDGKNSKRYRSNVIRKGQVGGNCGMFFDEKLLRSRADEKSYLQSWAHELAHFTSDPYFRISERRCDVIFNKPTVLIKLDAAVNMYHHFCDFVNLYASQHVNGSLDMDIDILWWDTGPYGYTDSLFGATWHAFTLNTPHELIDLGGKVVCFRNAMFSMLARQRLGLYYNMPLVSSNIYAKMHTSYSKTFRNAWSGLINAFSEHILYRLAIKQNGPLLDKIRITFLSRSTPSRKILNEDELMEVLRVMPNVAARKVDYNRTIPFLQQLEITHNSDILIGMHGSGLTHLLFLPDWAVVFELYNCGDIKCYLDLARLRGIKYFTCTRNDKVFPVGKSIYPQTSELHKKFQDYIVDKDEFRRLVLLQIEYVRRHPTYVKELRLQKRRLHSGEL